MSRCDYNHGMPPEIKTPTAEADRNRLAQQVRLACLMEASARKPGNVHPEASFSDLVYEDFVRAAEVVAPVLARSRELGVGPAVLAAIEATQRKSPECSTAGDRIAGNINLGIVLLIAPLAAVPAAQSLRKGIAEVLDGLTRQDAASAYAAIRLAAPGGLNRVSEQDVAGAPSVTLRDRFHRDSSNTFRAAIGV